MNQTRRDKFILACGSLGGVGYVPYASGTVTVVIWGVPLFYLMHYLPVPFQIMAVLGMVLAAVWLSGAGDRILGEEDSSKMVVDEIAGYLVAVIGLPFTWEMVLLTLILERAFDITKVPPANWIEKHVAGGWGVVLDDVVAGLYTLGLCHLILFLRPWPWW